MSKALRAARFAGAIAAVFAVSWLISNRVSTTEGVPARPIELLKLGEQLPNPIVHYEDGTARPLRDVTGRSGFATVVVFNTSCGSCAGEAIVWRDLGQKYRKAGRVIAIATTPDRGFVKSIAGDDPGGLTLLRGGKEVVGSLKATGSPTIYVTDGTGKIVFAATGDKATASVREWLARRASSLSG